MAPRSPLTEGDQLSCQDPAAEEARQPRRRLALGILFALTCIGILVGLWGLLPYLGPEHRRLEPWKVALLWVSDAASFVWFVWFVAKHLLMGRPLRTRPWAFFKREKEWLIALGTLLLAIGIDLAITLSLMYEERATFPTAVVVVGEVRSIQPILHPAANHYDLRCRYSDSQGVWHEGRFMVQEKPDTGFPPTLPAETAQAIKAGEVSVPIRVSYDPSWPDRSWLTDVGWDDGNRLHYYSLIMLQLQGLGLVGFIESLVILTYSTGRVPWWFDLHEAAPFLVEVAFTAYAGLVTGFIGYCVWA